MRCVADCLLTLHCPASPLPPRLCPQVWRGGARGAGRGGLRPARRHAPAGAHPDAGGAGEGADLPLAPRLRRQGQCVCEGWWWCGMVVWCGGGRVGGWVGRVVVWGGRDRSASCNVLVCWPSRGAGQLAPRCTLLLLPPFTPPPFPPGAAADAALCHRCQRCCRRRRRCAPRPVWRGSAATCTPPRCGAASPRWGCGSGLGGWGGASSVLASTVLCRCMLLLLTAPPFYQPTCAPHRHRRRRRRRSRSSRRRGRRWRGAASCSTPTARASLPPCSRWWGAPPRPRRTAASRWTACRPWCGGDCGGGSGGWAVVAGVKCRAAAFFACSQPDSCSTAARNDSRLQLSVPACLPRLLAHHPSLLPPSHDAVGPVDAPGPPCAQARRRV